MMTPLELVRRNNNLSQQELADKLGVSQTTIQRIEANKVWPNKKLVEDIVKVFEGEITTDEILWPENYVKMKGSK